MNECSTNTDNCGTNTPCTRTIDSFTRYRGNGQSCTGLWFIQTDKSIANITYTEENAALKSKSFIV